VYNWTYTIKEQARGSPKEVDMGIQALSSVVIGVVVAFFAPALVWSTVVAGLLQMARAKLLSAVTSGVAPSCRQQKRC
jgi:hypothetical protein